MTGLSALTTVAGWPVDNAAVVAVTRGGGVVGTTGDPQRRYRLASVTKLLTAYAALIAIEEGAVDLDTPAGPPGSTVRHLLAHASGLAFDEHKAVAQPGRRRLYSNAGIEVLAQTVAEHSGIAFADYLHAAVLTPLGMTATTLEGSPAHGAVSTAGDLGRFAAELLAPTLVHDTTFSEATSVVFPGLDGVLPGFGRQTPNDWGLGFELRDGKSPHWTGTTNSPRTFGHFGQSGTFLWVDPDAGTALVGLADRDFDEWAKDAWPVLADAVLADLHSRGDREG
jgi:CubicO group peptidase (beta-lactamase class C family)